MLISFRVENHRSLRVEQVLTMEAGRVGAPDDPRPRQVEGFGERILPVAAIFGANASGKTNVLSAIAWMRNAVAQSQLLWPNENGVPRDPFAWGPTRNAPSTYEIEFLTNSVRYQYGFVVSDSRIEEEWLFAWPQRHKQTWMKRDGDEFAFGEGLSGENQRVRKSTRPNSLFLSAAAEIRHPQLAPLYDWFRSKLVPLRLRNKFEEAFDEGLNTTFLAGDIEDEGKRAIRWTAYGFRSLLRIAGIVDVRARSEAKDLRGARRLEFKHESSSDDAWLSWDQESSGTRSLVVTAIAALDAIDTGKCILIDELEESLHPSLVAEIVHQFNDSKTNPKNGQLIFSTHDTSLLGSTMGDAALRRDQVWLTEKDHEGATTLYPLTDFKPRKQENLERGYLQGRYGAVPFLGDFVLSERNPHGAP